MPTSRSRPRDAHADRLHILNVLYSTCKSRFADGLELYATVRIPPANKRAQRTINPFATEREAA
jgi:hypothetical protein